MTKYSYIKVIQQYYQYCGWEDVCFYYRDEIKAGHLKADLKEYRLTGYPTRVINRRELNKSI